MGHLFEHVSSQNLHHMLTGSPWAYVDLFKKILNESLRLLISVSSKSYLIIDEVGFRKKGKQSACVGHQYLGSIGKDDNGQVAVTAALSALDYYCPVAMELFMPKDWADDKDRRDKAGVPPQRIHLTKADVALQLIKGLWRKVRSHVECVVFDAHYGYNQDFLYELMKREVPFVGDVRGKFSIYVSKPAMKVPKQTGRGRKFYKERPNQKSMLISKYMECLNANDFQTLTIRSGTKQVIHARYHLRKIWMHYKPQNCLLELYLLIQKRADGETKYSLAFFPGQKVSALKVAKAQAQRVFIERVFEEGKNIVGMADYQVRSWTGFHRHMSLCSLALLFLMEQKIKLKKSIGKITGYQIQQLLNATIISVDTLEKCLQKVIPQIILYQRQIANQLKTVT